MLLKLAFALFLLQLVENGSCSNRSTILPPPVPIASTSLIKLYAGDTFKMKCEMPATFKTDNSVFKIIFAYEHNQIMRFLGVYTVPATTSEHKIKQFSPYADQEYHRYIASVKAVPNANSSSPNVFEILITSKSAFSGQFVCYACQHTCSKSSGHVDVYSVAPSPPTPVLRSNVTHVHPSKPFTLSCYLDQQLSTFSSDSSEEAAAPHWDVGNYSVAFFSSRDGQLGVYEVDKNGHSVLSIGKLTKVSVHLGPRSTYPNFDLVLDEKSADKQRYWCELEAEQVTRQKKKSNYFNSGVFVDFSSSSLSFNGSLSEHHGQCSVGGFDDHFQHEYQVNFYTDLGTQKENLVGYFEMMPWKIPQFVHENLPHWTSIIHGVSKVFPNFEIITKIEKSALSGQNHKWWCALHIKKSANETMVIKSDLKSL